MNPTTLPTAQYFRVLQELNSLSFYVTSSLVSRRDHLAFSRWAAKLREAEKLPVIQFVEWWVGTSSCPSFSLVAYCVYALHNIFPYLSCYGSR